MPDKILIICNYFAPNNTIAAVRVTKIAKYLKRAGYEVQILCEKRNDTKDVLLENDAIGIKVNYVTNSDGFIRLYKIYKKLITPAKTKRMNNLSNRRKINKKTGKFEFYTFETMHPIIGSFDYLMEQFRQKNLAKNALKIFKLIEKPDFLITSYGDSLAYFTGMYYKKMHPDIPWIFDIRDAVYRYKFTPNMVKQIPLKYEKKAFKSADAIVGVSEGICNRVSPENFKKTYCITNGFDKEDELKLVDESVDSFKMKFCYTGSMYGGLQDLSLFFRALNELIREEKIEKINIEIGYAGNAPAFEIFKSQAEKYDLNSNLLYYGKVSRCQAMQIQKNSQILLMSSFDYENNNGGVLTGKLMEYMLAGKPVIAVINGDIKNSEVKQTIARTGIGASIEESNAVEDIIQLKEFIIKEYKEYTEHHRLWYKPNLEELQKFEYQNLVNSYIKILRSF